MNAVIAWTWLIITITLAATSLALTITGGTHGPHATAARRIDHALAIWCLLGLVYLFAGGTP